MFPIPSSILLVFAEQLAIQFSFPSRQPRVKASGEVIRVFLLKARIARSGWVTECVWRYPEYRRDLADAELA